MFSVIVPAHNEAGEISRCLAALVADRAEDEFEIVVVCNGCTDDTAHRAAAFGPAVRVLETAVASKVHALNLGDDAVSGFPRCYLDADVRISTAGLRSLVSAVSDNGPWLAAVPEARMILDGRSWPIRAFFSIWTRLPFFTDGMASSGVYVLSATGRNRFGRFPDLIADDHYVLSLFTADERRKVPEAVSLIETPTRVADVVRIKTRAFLGERQLASAGLVNTRQHGGRGGFLHVVARRPRMWPAAVVYVAINLVAELRARQRLQRRNFEWERAGSSRDRRPA